MRTSALVSDPAATPKHSWVGRLAGLKGHAVPDDDPRVVECRDALAYWRLRESIDTERGQLSASSRDRLIAQLRQGVAS